MKGVVLFGMVVLAITASSTATNETTLSPTVSPSHSPTLAPIIGTDTTTSPSNETTNQPENVTTISPTMSPTASPTIENETSTVSPTTTVENITSTVVVPTTVGNETTIVPTTTVGNETTVVPTTIVGNQTTIVPTTSIGNETTAVGNETTETTVAPTNGTTIETTIQPKTDTTLSPTLAPTIFHLPATGMTETESIIFAILAVPALVFAFTAHRYIKTAFFLAGGASLGYAFYVFSPMIFKNTEFCCGDNGTKLGHIVVSACVGLVGGLIALKVLKLGVFLIGAAFGILAGFGLMFVPVVSHQPFFKDGYALPVYYSSFGFVFGVIALFCKEKTIVFSSALSGSFIFLLGVDYFAKTSFNDVVKETFMGLEEDLKEQFNGDLNTTLTVAAPTDHNAYIMLGMWVVLLLITMTVQFIFIAKSKAAKNGDDKASDRRGNYVTETQFARREESETSQRMRKKYQSPARGTKWRRDRRSDSLGVSLLPASGFGVEDSSEHAAGWPHNT